MTKIALMLGRSVFDLKQFGKMASLFMRDEDVKDFAGKLFYMTKGDLGV